MRKDWQLSRLKALKEQEEKQLEQEDDEMIYTYARDNERKVNYKYTYSCARNSLVASEVARHKKIFAIAVDQASFSLLNPSSPLSFPPPLSPEIIQRSSTIINNHSKISDASVRRRRLQIVSSPPPQSSESIRKEKLSRIIITRHNNNNNNDIHSNSKVIYSSKFKTNIPTLTRRSIPHVPQILATKNTNSGSQQSTCVNINLTSNPRVSRFILKSNKSIICEKS